MSESESESERGREINIDLLVEKQLLVMMQRLCVYELINDRAFMLFEKYCLMYMCVYNLCTTAKLVTTSCHISTLYRDG